jgi:hypothetical protein
MDAVTIEITTERQMEEHLTTLCHERWCDIHTALYELEGNDFEPKTVGSEVERKRAMLEGLQSALSALEDVKRMVLGSFE